MSMPYTGAGFGRGVTDVNENKGVGGIWFWRGFHLMNLNFHPGPGRPAN